MLSHLVYFITYSCIVNGVNESYIIFDLIYMCIANKWFRFILVNQASYQDYHDFIRLASIYEFYFFYSF